MAFLPNTAFEARIVNDRFDDLANVAGKYYTKGPTALDCSAGLLVKREAMLPCEGFANINNENAWAFVAAGATDNIDVPIYACDPHDWPLLGNGRNLWAVGTETLGLGIPANRYGSFRRIHFDNVSVYRFGVGNTSDGGESDYYTIADGLLVPAESVPTDAGAVYFTQVGSGTFTEGTTASFGYIDVVACRVSVGA